jgi:hypothetical protein
VTSCETSGALPAWLSSVLLTFLRKASEVAEISWHPDLCLVPAGPLPGLCLALTGGHFGI